MWCSDQRILAISLLAGLAACSGPDPTLLRPKPTRDAGIEQDAGLTPAVDGGQVGPPVVPIDPGSVDGPTVSIDCMSDGEFTVCTRPHAESTCVQDDCLLVRCLGDWVDCDGKGDNGCETTLLSLDHCGRCGSACELANVVDHSCDEVDGAAQCAIDHNCTATGCMDQAPELGCKVGFGDCDGDPANGCELSLSTVGDCGSCGRSCALANTLVSCDEGRCVTVGCSPGFGTCGGDTCKSLAADADNCGECGKACPPEADMCSGGRCTSFVCEPDTADCNGAGDDGCEADLKGTAHCGTCGNACPGAEHATALCNGGSCEIACDPGFADCDGDMATGCEVDTTARSSCGGCNTNCGNLPHVVNATCEASVCRELECEEGWDDCNGDPKDGCERPLNTVSDCGSCGTKCSAANGVASCTSGRCEVTACDQGWDDCNGEQADGCEADLRKEPHCGGCGIECGEGSMCNGTGCQCTSNAGCSVGECCDGSCIDTVSHCTFWPCVPGDNKDFLNCGGCGVPCVPFVHQGCCGVL